MAPLLGVENLQMYFSTMQGDVKAVDNVTFELEKGQSLGFAGESGCGKSSLALTIMRLLPPNGTVRDGSITFDGLDLLKASEEYLRRRVRWRRMSIVFQGAMNAFTPVHRIGDQIVEAMRTHERVSSKEAKQRARQLLSLVGIEPSRAGNYPHEFSGGMRQRAMIAMALALNPDLVFADEPTTALDVIVQAQILTLLKSLRDKLKLSLVLISHDISAIAQLCDRVAIMYAGEIVEIADAADLFRSPQHPYTQGLLSAFPNIKGARKRLRPISGSPPDLLNPPKGCRFHPRCPYAMDVCREVPPTPILVGKGHIAACHLLTRG